MTSSQKIGLPRFISSACATPATSRGCGGPGKRCAVPRVGAGGGERHRTVHAGPGRVRITSLRRRAGSRLAPNGNRTGEEPGLCVLGDALLEFGELDQAVAAFGEMQNRKGDPIEAETRLARLDLIRGSFDWPKRISRRRSMQRGVILLSRLRKSLHGAWSSQANSLSTADSGA